MPLSGKKLAQDDVIKLQKEFLNCDLDGDGRISVKELEGVLNSLKKNLSPKKTREEETKNLFITESESLKTS